MAVKTKDFQVSRAIQFYKNAQIYFAIGKTSPWKAADYNGSQVPSDPEKEPPSPLFYKTMQEVIGYRKADKVLLVVPHDGSTVPPGTTIIEYAEGSQWRVVSEAEAYTRGACFVYLETTIMPTDFPVGEYRQAGVFTGTTRNDNVAAGKFALLPSEVKTAGILEILDNRQKSLRGDSTKEFLSFIIQF
jgi:hypothetical protein